MSPIDLSKILKGYEGKWVALSENNATIFASAESPKLAADEARRKGHKEFALLFVESSDLLYCG